MLLVATLSLAAPSLGLYGAKYAAVVRRLGANPSSPSKTSLSAGGDWDWESSSGWTSGFFPATLWLLAHGAADAGDRHTFLLAARQWTALQYPKAHDTSSHGNPPLPPCRPGSPLR